MVDSSSAPSQIVLELPALKVRLTLSLPVTILQARNLPVVTSLVASVVDFPNLHSLSSIESMAGLLLNNTVVTPRSTLSLSWFNKVNCLSANTDLSKKDFLYVRDFTLNTQTSSSKFKVGRITEETEVRFVSWEREKILIEQEYKKHHSSSERVFPVPPLDDWIHEAKKDVGGLHDTLPKIVTTVHRTLYPIEPQTQARGIIFQ